MVTTRLLAAVALAVHLSPAVGDAQLRAPDAPFGISKVIAQVKREIRAAQEERQTFAPLAIDKVTLTIQLSEASSAEAGAGGSVEVAGLELGAEGTGTASESTGRSITLEMRPSQELLTGGTRTFGLAEAIREVKEGVRTAMQTEPRFTLERFVFDFDFAIQREAEGGLKFVVFKTGGEIERARTHHLSVEFTLARAGAGVGARPAPERRPGR